MTLSTMSFADISSEDGDLYGWAVEDKSLLSVEQRQTKEAPVPFGAHDQYGDQHRIFFLELPMTFAAPRIVIINDLFYPSAKEKNTMQMYVKISCGSKTLYEGDSPGLRFGAFQAGLFGQKGRDGVQTCCYKKMRKHWSRSW